METKKLIMKVLRKSRYHDFWSSLSPTIKAGIEKGLADVDAARYTPAKDIIERLMFK